MMKLGRENWSDIRWRELAGGSWKPGRLMIKYYNNYASLVHVSPLTEGAKTRKLELFADSL